MGIAGEQFLLHMHDDIRPEALPIVNYLQRQGMYVSVLTGDSKGAANFIGEAVGGGVKKIPNATPEDKVDYFRSLGQKLAGKVKGVLSIGDGVKDFK